MKGHQASVLPRQSRPILLSVLAVLLCWVTTSPLSAAGSGDFPPGNPGDVPGPDGPDPHIPFTPHCPSLSELPAPFPPDLPSTPTAEAGTLQGAFQVSAYGHASYTIPIEVLPGRRSMTPSLALAYDSSGADGTVGIGFSVAGLSSIERCARNFAQDNYRRPVRDDKEDAFCLDGKRLVPVELPDGDEPKSDVTEYRTFPDTFVRVLGHQPPGAEQPTSFDVFSPSGDRLTYGSTPDSQVLGKGGIARSYWIAHVEDRSGNFIDYSYKVDVDGSDGHTVQHAPLRIDYGGHPQTPHSRAVIFSYATKPVWDRRVRFTRGMKVEASWLLDRISMVGPGDVAIRELRLSYDDKDPDGRYTHLLSAKLCAHDGGCLPETSFRWSHRGETAAFQTIDTGVEVPHTTSEDLAGQTFVDAGALTFADINGDGLSDLVVSKPVVQIPEDDDGEAVYATEWWTADALGKDQYYPAASLLHSEPFSKAPFGPGFRPDLGSPLDYNQDGRTDFFLHDLNGYNDTWHILVSQADGSFNDVDTEIPTPFPLLYPRGRGLRSADYAPDAVHLADWNGDGVTDLIQCDDVDPIYSAWYVSLWRPDATQALPTGGFDPNPFTLDFGDIYYPCSAPVSVADIDGDGAMELIIPEVLGESEDGQVILGSGLMALLFAADAASDPFSPSPTLVNLNLESAPTLLFVDVNDDGLPDVVHSDSQGALWTSLNTGDRDAGFFADAVVAVPSWLDPLPSGSLAKLATSIDYDQDGRRDLLLPMQKVNDEAPLMTILRSLGDGSFDLVDPNIPLEVVAFEDQVAPFVDHKDALRVTDIDGDGAEDVAQMRDFQLRLYRNTLGDADLLVSVSNGMRLLDPTDPAHVPNVAIHYGHLTDATVTFGAAQGSPDWEAAPYIADSGTQALGGHNQGNDCSYPRRCVVGPMRVVTAYEQNDGSDGQRHFAVAYRDGRAHRLGRGFLGFSGRLIRDLDTGRGTLTLYDNTTYDETFRAFTRAGTPTAEWHWNPGTPTQPSPELVEMSFNKSVLETRATYDGATYFLQPVITWRRREQGAFVVGQSAEPSLDQYVREVELHGASSLGESFTVVDDYDDFGGVLSETTFMTDLDESVTTTRTFDNLTGPWLTGLLRSRSRCGWSQNGSACHTYEATYDADGLLLSETTSDDTGSDSTWSRVSHERDAFGNIVESTAENAFGAQRTVCIGYDNDGLFPFSQGNAAGHIAFTRHDNATGALLTHVGANGLVMQRSYDGLGRMTTEVAPDGVVTTSALTRTQDGGPQGNRWLVRQTRQVTGYAKDTVELDALGRPVRVFSQNMQDYVLQGGILTPKDRRIQRDMAYDSLSEQLAWRTVPFEEGTPLGQVPYETFNYDGLGRVIARTTPWGATTTTAYLGRTVLSTDAGGTLTTAENDAVGRPVSITTADATTTYAYGPFGLLHAVVLPDQTKLTMQRDALGRIVAEVHPDRGTTTFDYDGFGQIQRQTDALGRKVDFFYDSLGRVRKRQDDDGTTRYTWDVAAHGVGNLAKLQSPTGVIDDFTYDALSRPESITRSIDGEVFSTSVTYDAFGRLKTRVYPQGPSGTSLRVGYLYDAYGHVTSAYDVDQNTTFWHANTTDGAGRLVNEVLGNGVTTERYYHDTKGQLDTIVTKHGATTLQDLSYVYDSELNLKERQDHRQNKTETFLYDDLDRLTCSHVVGSKGDCSLSFAYDPNGNMTSRSDLGGYTYDDPSHPHAVTTAGPHGYAYDAVGNQVSRPEGTVEYTARNKPRVFNDTLAVPLVDFAYDGGGGRAKKTSRTQETLYFAGLYERVKDLATGLTEHRFTVLGGERPVAVVSETMNASGVTSETRYLHVDHLGSVDVVSGNVGTEIDRRSYDAFGKPRNPAWGGAQVPVTPGKVPFDYTGHHADSELGLVDMGARLYDPVTARFLTTDPVVSPFAFSQSHNPYSYVMNAPLVYTDPTGRDAELVQNADGSYGLRDMVTGGVLPIPAEEVTVVSPALPRTTSADVAAPEPGTVQPPDTGTQGLSAIASSAPATPEVPGPAPLTADEVRTDFGRASRRVPSCLGRRFSKTCLSNPAWAGWA